jgi:outer membrane immunogenic protein
MRRSIVAFCLLAVASPTLAADFEPYGFPGSSPYVAAPPVFTRWSGFYAGGQAGFGTTKVDFTSVTALGPLNSFLQPYGSASSWASFGKGQPNAGAFGGFVGYNAQWDDVIIGIETNFNRTSLIGHSSASRCYLEDNTNTSCLAAISLGNPANNYDTTINAAVNLKITDYGTLRGRAGWAIDSFLPYVTAGLALGRAQLTRVTTTTGTPSPLASGGAAFSYTDIATSTQFLYGYEAGGGLDVMLSPAFFLRAEYEFIQFIRAAGNRNTINSVRGAIGVRF